MYLSYHFLLIFVHQQNISKDDVLSDKNNFLPRHSPLGSGPLFTCIATSCTMHNYNTTFAMTHEIVTLRPIRVRSNEFTSR